MRGCCATVPIKITWDPVKNAINKRKHHVSFETASRVFADPLRRSKQDRIEHGEERWQTIGRVDSELLLLVVHTSNEIDEDNENVELIRIISARRPDKKERKAYEDT